MVACLWIVCVISIVSPVWVMWITGIQFCREAVYFKWWIANNYSQLTVLSVLVSQQINVTLILIRKSFICQFKIFKTSFVLKRKRQRLMTDCYWTRNCCCSERFSPTISASPQESVWWALRLFDWNLKKNLALKFENASLKACVDLRTNNNCII